MEVKVGDFGLAAEMSTQKRKTICGTPNYIAPEVLDGRKGYSYKADIWSFGVILYTLIIGEFPFDGNTEKKIYRRIKINTYSFPNYINISEQAKDLIVKLLEPNPVKRLSLEEIQKHPFLENKSAIPKLLPLFTLHSAPSKAYIKEQEEKLQSTVHSPEGSTEDSIEKPKLTIADNESDQNANESTENSSSQTADSPKSESTIFIKKWVDCSAKYGIGYLLSNGLVGVFFNDSTKIILHPKGHFNYIDRHQLDKTEYIATYTLDTYPIELKKKAILLLHTKEQLEKSKEVLASQNKVLYETALMPAMIYLKKWVSTSEVALFRLNNKVIQAVFKDNTELIINPEAHEVAYVNMKGERSVCPSAVALMSSNIEMVKKLRTTKEILGRIASKSNKGKSS
jgi:polo-like kinase 1